MSLHSWLHHASPYVFTYIHIYTELVLLQLAPHMRSGQPVERSSTGIMAPWPPTFGRKETATCPSKPPSELVTVLVMIAAAGAPLLATWELYEIEILCNSGGKKAWDRLEGLGSSFFPHTVQGRLSHECARSGRDEIGAPTWCWWRWVIGAAIMLLLLLSSSSSDDLVIPVVLPHVGQGLSFEPLHRCVVGSGWEMGRTVILNANLSILGEDQWNANYRNRNANNRLPQWLRAEIREQWSSKVWRIRPRCRSII